MVRGLKQKAESVKLFEQKRGDFRGYSEVRSKVKKLKGKSPRS
jgi:hypothetical protein